MLYRNRKTYRRGVTIVVILGLLSVTLALSYAILRTQITSSQIQTNHTRSDNARQAAMTGLSLALKKIHSSSWEGIDVPLTEDLNDTDSYQISFETGDPNLLSSDADYWKFPYRLTITSTGYSDDPSNIMVRASHMVKAVVQLVPRAFSATPDGWLDAQQFSLNQWDSEKDAILEAPLHIEGDIRMQGPLKLSETYLSDVQKTFNGAIDEVAVFSRALTASELNNIYRVENGDSSPYSSLANGYSSNSPSHWWRLDESAGADTAIDAIGSQDGLYQFNAQPGTTAGVDGTSVQLDGHYGHVDLGNLNLSGSAMTILAWIKPDSFSPYARIVSKAIGTSASEQYWMLGTYTDGGQTRLRFILNAGGSATTLISNSGGLDEGEWVFVAAVYDGSKMYLYKNGVELTNANKYGSIATNANVPAWIGDNPPGSARGRYHADLHEMYVDGEGDYRPMTGPVHAPLSTWSDSTIALVRDNLDLTLVDIAEDNTPPASHPGEVTTYQLFPGGKIYNATALSKDITYTTIKPDITTNPLGILYRNGDLHLWRNNTIRGTIINNGSTGKDISIYYSGNELLPVEILPLDGDSSTYQLPTVIAANSLDVSYGIESRIEGLVVVFKDFEIGNIWKEADFTINGCLMCEEFKIKTYSSYTYPDSNWMSVLYFYLKQFMVHNDSRIEFFPKWLKQNYQFSFKPCLTIKPEPEPVVYHFPDFSQPLYAPGAGDAGLRWDLLRWIDGG